MPVVTIAGDTGLIETVNSTVNLTCQSTGYPQPSVVWQFNGAEMACNDSVSAFDLGTTTVYTRLATTGLVSGLIRSTTCVLSLANVGRDHRGNFTCIANNLAGSSLDGGSLFVQGTLFSCLWSINDITCLYFVCLN